jgi:hypothetical protein
VEEEGMYSKPIEIAREDRIPNDQLIFPNKRGNVAKDKETGTQIELHRKDPNNDRQYVEMKRNDHRGRAKYKENHPWANYETNRFESNK